MKNRIWEIDFFRGIAIVLMIAFHTVYDLREFYSYGLDYAKGFWYFEGKVSALLFMLVSGISATLSKSSLHRGIRVFGFGMSLSLVTFLYDPRTYIRFGILHLLGFSMIAHHYMGRWKTHNLLSLGIFVMALGSLFAKMTVNTSLLLPIGIINHGFASLDYYPIFPWFGVFIMGMILGRTLYAEKRGHFNNYLRWDPISYMGRHSLWIYLAHQPAILAILFIAHRI